MVKTFSVDLRSLLGTDVLIINSVMTLTLYYLPLSPPARSVLLTIRSLGLEVELKNVNLMDGEHMNEEFLKLNPLHQIPVLVDHANDDFIVTESRAIMAYLVNSRQPGGSLYPNEPKQRALIDQRLYYDATVIFPTNCGLIVPVILTKTTTEIPQAAKDKVSEYMKILNTFLADSLWFAGDKPTIADLSILANISQISACGYNFRQHDNIAKWFERCKALPGFDECLEGAAVTEKLFKSHITNGF